MTTELIRRYIHFISIFGIVRTLVAEYVSLKPFLTRGQLGRLSPINAVYGLAAITLLAASPTLWLGGFGKTTEFYTKNWIFHLKLTCFIAIGLLSIYPTFFFFETTTRRSCGRSKCP